MAQCALAASGPLIFDSDTAFDRRQLQATDPLWQQPDFELAQPAPDPALTQSLTLPEKTFLTRQELADAGIERKIPGGCRGTWYTPYAPRPLNTPATDPMQQPVYINAGEAYYRQAGSIYLKDRVLVRQPERSIQASEIALDNTQTMAEGRGNVRIDEPGLTLYGDQFKYHLQDQTGRIDQATYIAGEMQAHGHASRIERMGPEITELSNADYSTCEPQDQIWRIAARELRLNRATGQGKAKDVQLFVRDRQVVKLPFLHFPLDNRRNSGFLTPRFGYRNDSGFDLSIPYYLNLAANYDATVTPRILYRRGFMLEGEYRYLSNRYGQGILQGAYIPQDKLADDRDRYWGRYKADVALSSSILTHINLNHVSDKDFFTDFANNFISSISPHQERSVGFDLINSVPGLNARLKAVSFYTVDPDIAAKDRPYKRLPQLLLDYRTRLGDDWVLGNTNDFVYFSRDDETGYRIYNNISVQKQFDNRAGYLRPELTLRHLTSHGSHYEQQDNTYTLTSPVEETYFIPQVALHGGLVFERDGKYAQTLEPRLTYVYAPYRDQSALPNFDTTAININYDQLFNPYRFAGNDRIEDNNFATVALTHRLFDDTGMERSTFSVGERFYMADRRVLLPYEKVQTSRKSGVALQGTVHVTPRLRLDGSTAFNSSNNLSNTVAQLNYLGKNGLLAQAGYVKRRTDQDYDQTASEQLVAGLVQPLADRWRLFGYVQYDFDYGITREEMLGVDYDSCCWRFSVYERKFYNNLDDISVAKAKKAIMAEVSLKGMGGFSSSLGSILRDRINGYTDAENAWKERQ